MLITVPLRVSGSLDHQSIQGGIGADGPEASGGQSGNEVGRRVGSLRTAGEQLEQIDADEDVVAEVATLNCSRM